MTARNGRTEEGGALPGFTVRRIVVAVDSSAHATAALEAAVALAARMRADMEALFVEDIDLFNLAALPFGHEIVLTTGRPRTFDTTVLEEQLRREVNRARRAVETVARRARVHATFRVARGRIVAEVVAAAGEADLLILGAAGQGMSVRFRPGRVALAAAERAPRSVLLLRKGEVIRGRPLVAYDASPSAETALDAAARFADATHASVRVLIAEADETKAAALRERAAARLGAAGIRAVFSDAYELTLDTMCRTVQQTDADVMVLAADNPRLEGEGRRRLLERITCPVLLVR